MCARHVKGLLWVWCILLFLSVSAAHTADPDIQIIGSIRYSSGDNPLWSSLSFDDTSWRLTDKLTIREKILPRSITWYRIHFRFPEQNMNDPAILINPSSGADEIFLNGVKIGGEGTVGDKFIGAPKSERLCRIPAGLINPHGKNILALRVMATHLEEGRFNSGIRIDDYNKIILVKLDYNSLLKRIEVFFLFFLIVFFIPYLILLFGGWYKKGMEYFGFFFLFFMFTFLMKSLLFFETGLANHILQRITFAFYPLIPVVITIFLSYFMTEKTAFYLKAVTAISVLPSFMLLVFFNTTLYSLTSFGWFILTAVCSFEMLRVSLLGCKRKVRQSGTILIGSSGLAAAGILSALESINIINPVKVFNESLPVFGVSFFVLFRVIAVVKDMISTKTSQISLSKRILNAHEEERMRLARELHDGLGQSLLAVKLGLQMVEAKAEKDVKIEKKSISRLVSEISLTVEELRRISMDLRPASLEGIGIGEIINHYAMKCQADSGLQIIVDAKETIDISPKIKDNLYRICQETLTNAIKHADASEVSITLQEKNGILFLEVRDNGKGFNYRKKDSKVLGIGLSTIQERVELLNGALKVESKPMKGTVIRIEMPIK